MRLMLYPMQAGHKALAVAGDHFGAMQDAGRAVVDHIELNRTHLTNEEERNGPPQSAPESHLFRAGPPRLARNTVIESTFEVGRRFHCAMRIDCSQLEPGTVIRPVPGEGHPHMPAQLGEEELADWRAGRAAVYQLAALTVAARLAVADGYAGGGGETTSKTEKPPAREAGAFGPGDLHWRDIDRPRRIKLMLVVCLALVFLFPAGSYARLPSRDGTDNFDDSRNISLTASSIAHILSLLKV